MQPVRHIRCYDISGLNCSCTVTYFQCFTKSHTHFCSNTNMQCGGTTEASTQHNRLFSTEERFEVLMVVTMKTTVFRDMTLCSVINGGQDSYRVVEPMMMMTVGHKSRLMFQRRIPLTLSG
jgi:hypothetical protein